MIAGILIREARRRAGLTQKQLAERLHTAQPAIARWEGDVASPSFETLLRAVRACGFDLRISLEERDDHDLGLALSNLRLTPEERIDQMLMGLRFADELRDAASNAS